MAILRAFILYKKMENRPPEDCKKCIDHSLDDKHKYIMSLKMPLVHKKKLTEQEDQASEKAYRASQMNTLLIRKKYPPNLKERMNILEESDYESDVDDSVVLANADSTGIAHEHVEDKDAAEIVDVTEGNIKNDSLLALSKSYDTFREVDVSTQTIITMNKVQHVGTSGNFPGKANLVMKRKLQDSEFEEKAVSSTLVDNTTEKIKAKIQKIKEDYYVQEPNMKRPASPVTAPPDMPNKQVKRE